MSAKPQPFSIVCLSPQEWDAPLPTNRQQIMSRAARRGHTVLFVETGHFLGTHAARLLRGRDRRSLVRRMCSTEPVAPGIRAVKAINLAPWGRRFESACAVNNALTARRLRRLVAGLPPPVVAWIYDPCSAGLAESLDVAFTAYDCVDDYAEQTGGDPRRHALVAAEDAHAARISRVVFATSRTQQQRLSELNANAHLVRNVGDYGHFAPAADRSWAAPEVLALPRPVIGFAGNLLPGKVDFRLLEQLATRRPAWTLLLVGPVPAAAGAPLDRLRSLPNVHLLGRRAYDELPRYVAAFDVGLIPYLGNAYTRSCFPLKLYEYLAAAKPVVATGLPELAGMEPDVVLTDGVDGVIEAVERALAATGPGERARRNAIAAKNTWETRASRLLDLVSAELEA